MSETRATTPVFPPGRYGRRRDGRRHLGVPITFGAIVLVVCVALTVKLYHQYGASAYDSQIVGWGDVTDSQMTVHFTVSVPAGGSASCVLRARTYDGTEVGRRTVTVRAEGDDTSIDAREPVPTTARASVGEVLGCRAPG